MHYVMIHPWQDPQCQWLATRFQLTEEEVEAIVHEWAKEWCVYVPNDQIVDDDLDQDKPPSSQHKYQEEDPQEDAQVHDPTLSGSSSTPTDLVIEENWNQEEAKKGES